MKKILKLVVFLVVLVCIVDAAGLIADRQTLKNNLVRLHVVAQSNSEEDQRVKLEVRDAVLKALEKPMAEITDISKAKDYIQTHLPAIEQAANDTLKALGVQQRAVVTFLKEKFPVREYDSFTLPSGVYESLRITIGDGEGRNWWCVVFPKLCVSAASVEDTAAGAGFSEQLTDAITQKQGYRIRFLLLDILGKIENLFY